MYKTKNSLSRRLLAMLMAVVMTIGLMPSALAAEGENSTKYSVSVREDIANGTVSVSATEAAEGTTVTITATPSEGYVLTQVGYWTVAEDGKAGSINTISAGDDGSYTFAMPASNVMVGAAFQPESALLLINNKIGGSNDTDYWTYVTNHHAFLSTSDSAASVHIQLDTRYLDCKDLIMNVELRQYTSSGYKVAGRQTFSYNEWSALCGDTTYSASNDREYVTIQSLEVPLNDGVSFIEGYYEYAVVQLSLPTWEDAKGQPAYRWVYTNDATILAEDAHVPQPIVWLYNLDANSFRGAIIRDILDDLGIECGTVDSSSLGQNIGYLADWEGYAPVDDPYCTESFDMEYMLMCNLTDYDMDVLLHEMSHNNVSVDLKSVPTAWTATKTFNELFAIMTEESEVIIAAFALDAMIDDAEALLDDPAYAEHHEALKAAIAKAVEALSTDVEETGEGAALYINAREELLALYLDVTGKILIDGHDLQLNLTQETDGTYTVSAEIPDLPEASLSYSWSPFSLTSATINVTEDQLYKIRLTVTGTGSYYGEATASLSVPTDPTVSVSAGKTAIRVTFDEISEGMNMPAPDCYVAQLYLNGELVAEQQTDKAGTVTFNKLTSGTEYQVKTYASNVVGRSNIQTVDVETKSGSSSVKPPVTQPETPETPEVPDEPSVSPTFTDVAPGAWYAADVAYAAEQGLMTGTSDTTFSPNATTTRAMLMTILARLAGEDTTGGDSWYEKGMAWAMENGISDGSNPTGNITREQLATMLWRYAGSRQVDGALDAFVDGAQVSDYAVQAMVWAVENGIVTGNTDGTLNLQGSATRAQMAAMLHRFCENIL